MQMNASPSAASARPHFSHSFFISSAIGSDDSRQILRNWNAQNEFNHYAGAEDVDLRDGGEFGAVAANFAALSLHSLSRTQSESKRGRDGGAPLRNSNQV